MKKQHQILILFLSIIYASTFNSSCKKAGADFILDNRCGDPSVTVRENHEFGFLFSSDTGQLSAGEIASELRTSDGKTIWLVNNASLNKSGGSILLHNCLVVKEGSSVSVKYAADSASNGLVASPATGSWYTLNSGIENNGKYEFIVSLWTAVSNKAYDYRLKSNSVVVLDPNSFAIESTSVIDSGSDIHFGSCIFPYNGYNYIYGARNNRYTKDAFIARIPYGSLRQQWNYYDGNTWQSTLTNARPILSGISDYFSVFEYDGTFYLLSQASLFGQQVTLYRSLLPEGEWVFHKMLYCRDGQDDTLLSSNTIIQSVNGSEKLSCTFSLIDKSLLTTSPHKPMFIDIEHWR
jgi:hypothetical protein